MALAEGIPQLDPRVPPAPSQDQDGGTPPLDQDQDGSTPSPRRPGPEQVYPCPPPPRRTNVQQALFLTAQDTVTLILALIGKGAATMAFTVIYTYSSEIYPTEYRNVGMGGSSLSARISGMAAPYVGGILVSYTVSFSVYLVDERKSNRLIEDFHFLCWFVKTGSPVHHYFILSRNW